MGVTANWRTDLSPATSPLRLFMSVRPVRAVLSVTVLLGVLTAGFGQVQAPIPMAVQEEANVIPLWRLVTMGAAVLPAIALSSPLSDLEQVATRQLRSMQRRYLATLGIGCAVIYLTICSVTLRPTVVAITARSWLAWYGLALVAGAVLGWRLAWTLPSAVAVVLWYWGYGGGQQYRWWEFSARPQDDLPSLILSLGLFGAGLAVYAMTPWRRRRWTPPPRTASRGTTRSAASNDR